MNTDMPDLRNMTAEEQADLVSSLKGHMTPSLRIYVASSSDTHPEVVEMLSRDSSTDVRVAVVSRKDRNTAAINYQLRNDPNPAVTQAIADNYLTTAATLEDLSYFAERKTLFLILENTNTSEEVRDRIKADLFR